MLSADSLTALQNLVAPSGPCVATPAAPTTLAATSDSAGSITVTTPTPAAVTAGSAGVSQPVHDGSTYAYTVTGDPNTTYTVTVTPTGGVIDATTCTSAVQKLVAALDPSPGDSAWADVQAVNADQLALASAISKLEKAAAAGGSGGGTSGGSAGGSRASATPAAGSGSRTGSTAAPSGSSAGASATVASPEQLVADQAAIDAATAQSAVAVQNRDQATIRSPIAGTVAAVGLVVGSAAGSNSITIIGPGAEEVTTTVSLNMVDLVKVGEPATVAVDGNSVPLSGRVTSIGVLNSTTGTTTTFPVTVLLDATKAKLFDGAGAAVSITASQVSDVLSVPSSAVHSAGTLHTVTVLSGGKTSVVRVQTGAVGVDRTQITSGLKAGQRVVLAQTDAPLPSTGSTTRGTGVGVTRLGGTGLGGTGLTGGGTFTGGGTRTGG